MATTTVEVRNPSDITEIVGTAEFESAEAAAQAVRMANEAQKAWARRTALERGDILYRAALRLDQSAGEIADLASREMGKPIAEMRSEVRRGGEILRYYAGEGARALGEVYPSARPGALLYTWRRPLGVVALITPWNFPVAIPLWKIAPALVFGNAVVWKPAEWATLTAQAVARVLVEAGVPEEVLRLVPGLGKEVGAALVQERVAAISFTGSEATGRLVAQAAIMTGARLQLEMGGKNAVVIWEDADLHQSVDFIVSGAMRSAGQKCTATSRVFVHARVEDEVRDRLVAEVGKLRVGSALEEDTYVGPLVSASQLKKVAGEITRAKEAGARVLAGGTAPETVRGRRGHYVLPTLFDRVSPEMAIAQEEVFGPVVAMLPVHDFKEAVQAVNGVRYGLSATLATRDLDLALAFASEADVGLVRVNEETAGVEYQAPFGGEKASGSGSREQGRAALEFYTASRTVTLRPSGPSVL